MSRSATSTCFLNTSRDGDSTTSLGSLFQCLTTLSVQKISLISNLYLPWCNLRPLPPVAWSCCDPSAGPGIWPCWASYNWPRPIDPVCADPPAQCSYPRADWHSHPAWCHLQTYWGSTRSPHPDHWQNDSEVVRHLLM